MEPGLGLENVKNEPIQYAIETNKMIQILILRYWFQYFKLTF